MSTEPSTARPPATRARCTWGPNVCTLLMPLFCFVNQLLVFSPPFFPFLSLTFFPADFPPSFFLTFFDSLSFQLSVFPAFGLFIFFLLRFPVFDFSFPQHFIFLSSRLSFFPTFWLSVFSTLYFPLLVFSTFCLSNFLFFFFLQLFDFLFLFPVFPTICFPNLSCFLLFNV